MATTSWYRKKSLASRNLAMKVIDQRTTYQWFAPGGQLEPVSTLPLWWFLGDGEVTGVHDRCTSKTSMMYDMQS